VKPLVPVAALVLLAAACTLPPYNEDLSLAQMSAADMKRVAEVGPLQFWSGDFEGKEVFFYPSKDALTERMSVDDSFPLRGFLLVIGEYSARMIFIGHDGTNYYRGNDYEVPLDNSDPDRFSYVTQTLKDGSATMPGEHLGAAVFAPDGARWYADFDEYFAMNVTDLNAAGPAIGASFFPVNGISDYLYVLHKVGPEDYSEETWNAAGGSLIVDAAATRSSVLPGLPAGIESAFYFHNPDPALLRRSYLSWYDPQRRGYRNFWWNDDLQLHVMTHPDRRIDLVLSNGWLFSRGENLGYLYDADGRHLNQFALGGLELVYEIYLGGVPQVVFTIGAWAPAGKNDNPDFYLLVYTLPTSKLADL
jgi:hypothetical protein